MSVAPAVRESHYDFHGCSVAVSSSEPAVLQAMDLRLRDFGVRCAPARAKLHFQFTVGDAGGHAVAGTSRPIYETRHGTLSYWPEADVIGGRFGGVELTCHASDGVARLECKAFAGRDLYLATHPLATIALMEMLERRGLFSLHAACLATRGGSGLLVAGPSGAGKTTLTLALARAGMSFLSDDLVFLVPTPHGNSVRVLGFADTIGFTDYAAEQFGELRPLLTTPAADGFPKRLYRIDALFGAAPVMSCEPRTLVFPEVTPGQPSALTPIDPGEAMLRLVPDVLVTEPAATQAHLAALAALLSDVRCYALGSGTDLDRAAKLVGSIS